ncbi:hypothetical protein EDD80_103258 [Anseongella ginsenosidimutans]|uniref:Uncharacterized protein n=1 Tax=Anseongella ginsenosidimutans TaxID=496056 RepID=A0A4R3KTA8_9SPHI|nr:hypothetical protein [Anseongella ginsenosidimutans]QEC53494.1 hypothetical protein FRZ59_14905 [Anseongella ginsenosidimutans]TCS88394.1 hypothetical protein EDD80_103258 [Anseongella ginsenosidimutans]
MKQVKDRGNTMLILAIATMAMVAIAMSSHLIAYWTLPYRFASDLIPYDLVREMTQPHFLMLVLGISALAAGALFLWLSRPVVTIVISVIAVIILIGYPV